MSVSILDDVARCVVLRARDRGLAERDAEDMGVLVAADLRRQWGGDRPYIALGRHARARERHARIHADFGAGVPPRELATRYGLALSTIYDIVRPLRPSKTSTAV